MFKGLYVKMYDTRSILHGEAWQVCSTRIENYHYFTNVLHY